MLKQQVLGIMNLSFPLVVLYQFFPVLILSVWGRAICTFFVGFYVWYLNRKQTNNLANSLKFSPSGDWKEKWENQVRLCNVSSVKVTLRYAYTAESVAMTVNNTVIIDPVAWSLVEADPEAQKVKDIFHKSIEPSLSEAQKSRIEGVRGFLTEPAQYFIFRHELGHVVRHFSRNKLYIVFAIGYCFAFVGLSVAAVLLPVNEILALCVGMVMGGIVDLLLTYATNYFFKVREEREADLFAVRYSTTEEIEAAATFFEKHQELLDASQNKHVLTRYLPLTVLTGYLDGKARGAWLRKLRR